MREIRFRDIKGCELSFSFDNLENGFHSKEGFCYNDQPVL